MKIIKLGVQDLERNDKGVYIVSHNGHEIYGYYSTSYTWLREPEKVVEILNDKVNLDRFEFDAVITPIKYMRINDEGTIEPMSGYLGRMFEDTIFVGSASKVQPLVETFVHEIGHIVEKHFFTGDILSEFKKKSGYYKEDYSMGWHNSVHECLAEMFQDYILGTKSEIEYSQDAFDYYLEIIDPIIRKGEPIIEEPEPVEEELVKKVVIDPGHFDGCANKGANGYYEDKGMWKMSCYLQMALNRCGIFATRTRAMLDSNPSLRERGNMAAGADVFISLHSNAAGTSEAKGVEVYYSVDLPNNKEIASYMSKSIADVMGTANRGAKTRESINYPGEDYYGVIDAAQDAGCPNVFLTESGFHTNLDDEAFLLKEENIKKIAERIAMVLCIVLDVEYIGGDDMEDWEKEFKEAWDWATEIGLNDGVGQKNNVTEEQMMVFFKRFEDYIIDKINNK